MSTPNQDLFEETTMTFGEHLEELRIRLWMSVIGIVLGVVIALIFGEYIIQFVSSPINAALAEYGIESQSQLEGFSFSDFRSDVADWWAGKPREPVEAPKPTPSMFAKPDDVVVTIERREFAEMLHEMYPEQIPPPAKAVVAGESKEPTVELVLSSSRFADLKPAEPQRPVTFNVQEAFLTYLKVALVAGLVLASPWVCYQMWLFVAAGLYPHERKYVQTYLPFSIALFLIGAMFCFYAVFPFVLDFLLGFNERLGLTPQIRMSEWISFALMLPVMFGLSFQLPLVMLVIERLGIVDVEEYSKRRRMAILVIAVISMFMTPADPMSMLLMMLPLVGLYELGIWMCRLQPEAKNPFGTDADAPA
ncbi:twin-arginine translocase subunit TatC [Stratiformator vulcanicus]|uniref:Sec-independent protein translocase protein TatC n=1 Tax=Stratiformator vulcanicus TaxID=2527980 RepID=A0A517R6D2_9PLAN|nr:twin-arginine translocase subunit TatC [Stratiformator vulcanicus]QDT39438.1 Sec-independent protein translocase protein TatCy [Stratiformator vulcanicus]